MLPNGFKERMKDLLGDGYDSFINELECTEAVKGVRVNTVKISREDFLSRFDLPMAAIPYCDEGFIPEAPDGIGNTPEHHSGMIYMQDPGAMAALCALDIKTGWRALDMCAAPGGKASQIAAKLGDSGFLVANEFVPKRAKTVVQNFERLGIKNAIVTSLDTSEFPRMFSEYFDLVVCDAPCSGEGMFRKSDEAKDQWSYDNVLTCQKRQIEILKNAPSLVKPGGYLLYSTCTYSREENEAVVELFLKENPEFQLVEVTDRLKAHTLSGIADGYDKELRLERTRRFYPHVSKGEGQFVALMKKSENTSDMPTILYKNSEVAPQKSETEIVKRFFAENFSAIPDGRLVKHGDGISLVRSPFPLPVRSVFMAGVQVGCVLKGVLHPAHQLFSAFGNLMKRKHELSYELALKYLAGEEISCEPDTEGGWCCVTYGGVALGGGKVSGGKIKNHYPKGLRLK